MSGAALVWPAGVLARDVTLRTLVAHNAWRRGGEGPATDPALLGKALDAVIGALSIAGHVREACSMVAAPLAVQIADAAVRSDIECYAERASDDDLERVVYDTTKPITCAVADPAAEAEDLATIQRALRYIEQRGDALPFVLHRSAESPHLVWFEDRAPAAPLTGEQRMAAEYAEAVNRG